MITEAAPAISIIELTGKQTASSSAQSQPSTLSQLKKSEVTCSAPYSFARGPSTRSALTALSTSTTLDNNVCLCFTYLHEQRGVFRVHTINMMPAIRCTLTLD